MFVTVRVLYWRNVELVYVMDRVALRNRKTQRLDSWSHISQAFLLLHLSENCSNLLVDDGLFATNILSTALSSQDFALNQMKFQTVTFLLTSTRIFIIDLPNALQIPAVILRRFLFDWLHIVKLIYVVTHVIQMTATLYILLLFFVRFNKIFGSSFYLLSHAFSLVFDASTILQIHTYIWSLLRRFALLDLWCLFYFVIHFCVFINKTILKL